MIAKNTHHTKTSIILRSAVVLVQLVLAGGCTEYPWDKIDEAEGYTVYNSPVAYAEAEADDTYEDAGFDCMADFTHHYSFNVRFDDATILVPTTSPSTGAEYKPSLIALMSRCPVYSMVDDDGWFSWTMMTGSTVVEGSDGAEFHQVSTAGVHGVEPLCKSCCEPDTTIKQWQVYLPTPPSGDCADYGQIEVHLTETEDDDGNNPCEMVTCDDTSAAKTSMTADAPSSMEGATLRPWR
jgi:hypothetical protein